MTAKLLSSLFVAVILTCFGINITFAADGYDTRCTAAANVTTTSGNSSTTVMISDSCDSTKFLACRNERCACADPLKQIYTYREYKAKDVPPALIRSKRSPAKGGKVKTKSKGVSTGGAIAGGVVAGVAGYQLGKAVGGSNNNDGGSSFSSSSNSNRKVQIFSCYSRIQGDCAIDPKRTKTIVHSIVRKDETTGNTTTTTETEQVDYAKYPICIANAECQRKVNTTSNDDPNIGECVCKDGYKRSTTDLCIKTNGVSKMAASLSIVSMLGFVLFIQMFTIKS